MSGKVSWRRYVSYETYRGEISGRGKHEQRLEGRENVGLGFGVAAATVTREPREEAARGASRAPGTERHRGSGCLSARGRSAPC